MKRHPTSIEARSIVSGRNLEPYIQIVLLYSDGTEEQVTQWTPAEAYHHAMAVIAAVEAANTDAFLVSFATGEMELPVEATGPLLVAFRKWRNRRDLPEQPV